MLYNTKRIFLGLMALLLAATMFSCSDDSSDDDSPAPKQITVTFEEPISCTKAGAALESGAQVAEGTYLFFDANLATDEIVENWYVNDEKQSSATASWFGLKITTENADNADGKYSVRISLVKRSVYQVVSTLDATASDVVSVIQGVTETEGVSKIRVSGTVTNETITAIRDALIAKTTSVKIDLDLSAATGLEKLEENSFYDNEKYNSIKSLVFIELPASLKEIDSKAFYNCSKLARVTLNEGLKKISDSAFDSTALTEIALPASVYSVSRTSFGTKLTKISVASGNLTYKTNDDNTLLLSKDGTKLVFGVPTLATLDIPSTVTEISDSAFYYNENLASVTIPDTVKKIGEWAFDYCSKLETVRIGSGVTEIGQGAFLQTGSKKLSSVTFSDTAGWKSYASSTSNTGTSIDVSVPATNAANFISGGEWCYKTLKKGQ